jgi:hypothetical protein
MSRPTDLEENDRARRPLSWVTIALLILGGCTLILALASAVVIAYTWLTDGIGA